MVSRPRLPNRAALGEILAFSYDTFASNRIRFALTALGMMIGTASVILVVSIGLAGKEYVLRQIESIGVNWVFAEYEGGAQGIPGAASDPLTIRDFDAVMEQVPGISAGSPIVELYDDLPLSGGRTANLHILGVFPDYERVRNLIVTSGRFFDVEDARARNKLGVITESLAQQLYGSTQEAVGQVIKLNGLPFTVVGTFKERVNTFGRSEVNENTIAIPYNVSRLFTNSEKVKQLYFSVSSPSDVAIATDQIQSVLKSRHRPESVYSVSNLTQLVSVANKTANALTMVLVLIAVVTLLVSGIGIMNIMLSTVVSRTREIGIRKAIGATRREICLQFLSEALLISLIGGIVGVIVGLSLPVSIRVLTDYDLPISGASAVVGILISSIVGISFGTIPALRAARMDPIASLHYE
jgi:putative ABC transport system permease protein